MVIRRISRGLSAAAFVAVSSPALAGPPTPSSFIEDAGDPRVCFAVADPHFKASGGPRFDFYGEGEFMLYSSPSSGSSDSSGEAIHTIQQVVPGEAERTYQTGVAFQTSVGKAKETLFTAPIDPETATGLELMFRDIKGNVMEVGPEVRRIGAFTIKRFCVSGDSVDKRQLLERIAVTADGGAALRVELRREDGASHLDTSVKVPSHLKAEGVCGPLVPTDSGVDPKSLPDCAPPEGVKVDPKASCADIAETWRITSEKDSLFP